MLIFHLLLHISIRSEEHTSELQSHLNLVCRLLLEKKTTGARASAMATLHGSFAPAGGETPRACPLAYQVRAAFRQSRAFQTLQLASGFFKGFGAHRIHPFPPPVPSPR